MRMIYDLELPELAELLKSWQEPAYRAKQIWQGVYRQYYNSPDQFSNLSRPLREKLAEHLDFSALQPRRQIDSSDSQTRKLLFELSDGLQIETVLMRYDPTTHAGRDRRTLCISTQAGCAMGCVFCATGQMGFKRNLSSGEIVAQVIYFARVLKDENLTVTNVVMMGMGEPFHNYDNTMAAIDRLNDPQGYNLGARRFTISTVGLVPAIRRFADEKRQVNLAISLHSVDEDTRLAMMPITRRHNIDEILHACNYYVMQTNRRVSIEWALISGVNDSPEVARQLANRLRGLMCHVNAIPLNPTVGYPGAATSRDRAMLFKETLEQAGIPCTIRMRRGIDIQAGCGQLAGAVSSSPIQIEQRSKLDL